MNSPAPIGAGVGRSLPSERLFRLQQGLGGSGMGLKRGHLGTAPQLEQLLNNLRQWVYSVRSRRPCTTGHCQLVVNA